MNNGGRDPHRAARAFRAFGGADHAQRGLRAAADLCYSVWLFGISAAALIATTTAACVLIEHWSCRMAGRETSIGDFSVVITGILLGLTLPPGLPLWMAAVGAFIAVAPGKMLFGGLGFNVFNPALVGRAFLQAAFPVAITSYTPARALHRFAEFIPTSLATPFLKAAPLKDWMARVQVDGFTGATPLMLQKFEHVTTDPWTLFLGDRAGSSGETCASADSALRLLSDRAQNDGLAHSVAMLLGALLTGGAYHLSNPARYPGPLFVLFSGGLMLGALFMATDPVASPVTPRGMWIYGLLMGLITVLIRFEGGLRKA
jgi:electron transport complex protein RnfD